MTNIMPFPPRARKSAGIVKEGHEHLHQTSAIIHQHRFSLASQIRNFDARWASLFNLAPVLNKLTKGRQMPTEFRDNAQVLLDDVQHALHDAHGRKLARIPEEGDSIIPGPPPPAPVGTGRQVLPQAPSDKQSIVVRVRSKLRRKRAVKRKGSKKGPLSRFNPFRSKSATPPLPQPTPAELLTIQPKPSKRTTRSGGGSSNSSNSSWYKNKERKKRSTSRLRDTEQTQAPGPPLVEPEWRPYLPPPPNFSPMKLDMSSIGYYSPTIAKPLLYQPPPWPGIGIVNPSVAPSSPQPYYLSTHEQKEREKEMRKQERKERREKREKRRASSSRSHDHGGKEREHREEDRSPRRHKHHHRSHDYSDAELSRKDRQEGSADSRRRDQDHRHHHRGSSRDDDNRRSEKDREKDKSESRHASTRRHGDTSRRNPSSKGSSIRISHRYPSSGPPSSYTHPVFQPFLPQVVERSRFMENFSVIS